MEKVHLIGIGGTGLSAIAKVLLEQGYRVSGSDQTYSKLAEAVDQAGGRVYVGHAADQVLGADLVIRSSAVPEENIEVRTARDQKIPVMTRREFLSRLTRGKRVIAVAGSHGKTTTTSMLTWILIRLEKDPSFIVGGVLANLGTNAGAGRGEHFVIEADEYDHMFLGLEPDLELITNIEHDHPDIFPTEKEFRQAFLDFTRKLKEGGELIMCGDDPGTRDLAGDLLMESTVYFYGVSSADLSYRARDLMVNADGGVDFDFDWAGPDGQESVPVSLQLAGRHNVLNAAASLAAADRLGLSVEKAARALKEFQGSGRRFEIVGQVNEVVLIDDYAHHPTEIAATLDAARDRFPESTLWAVWEPHTYSRIQTLAADFAGAFTSADRVVITQVYPAREVKPPGFRIQEIAARIQGPQAELFHSFADVVSHLSEELGPGDVVIVLSAGDAVDINRRLSLELEKK